MPEDWSSWLALADRLSAQGDSRGAQIELEHRVVRAMCPVERAELQRQAAAHQAAHQERWLSGWTRPAHSALWWERGFVRELHFLAGASLPEALVQIEALAVHPAGRLEGLVFSGVPLGDEGARQLAACSVLPRLRKLALLRAGLGPEGLRALVGSFGSLVELRLDGNPLGDEGAAVLAEAGLSHLSI